MTKLTKEQATNELTNAISTLIDGCEHDIEWKDEWMSATCGKCHETHCNPRFRGFNLEDVLMSLEKKAPEITQFYDEKKDDPSNYWITGIHTDGSFLQTDYMAGGYLIHHGDWKWHLGKLLREQDESTIRFLHSLLK